MAKHNRIAALCLAAAVMLLVLLNSFLPAAAAVTPDLQRKCSVLFTFTYREMPLVGGNLKMYRIADWTERNGAYDFTWVPELADAGLNLVDKDSEVFARHVSLLIESRSLPAIERAVNENGQAAFKNLDCGLYVVYQTQAPKGYEPINAYCISLPILLDGELAYDLRAAPKPRPEEITTKTQDETKPDESTTGVTTPDVTKPGESTTKESTTKEYTTSVRTTDVTDPTQTTTTAPSDKQNEILPSTGQLWWPAWLTGAVGAILFGFGFVLRVMYRESAEESET